MAAPKGILALLASKPKGSADSLPGESAGPGSPSALEPKAAALKAMWGNMKAGDFEAAALDFQEAYDACAMAHEDDEEDEMGPLADEEDDEMEL
jgi:hypothetical protein